MNWYLKSWYFLYISSDAFLNATVEDLMDFFKIDISKEDENKNCIGKDDALFVKSEDTLVFALSRWIDRYTTCYRDATKNDNNKSDMCIEQLAQYINWKEVSEGAIEAFSSNHPNVTCSGIHSFKFFTVSLNKDKDNVDILL